jgi:hypothetical protein
MGRVHFRTVDARMGKRGTNSHLANDNRGSVDHLSPAPKFFKKMMLSWNKLGSSVFHWLGALICPPAQVRRSAPRRPSLRGAFFVRKFAICFYPMLAGAGS